MKNILFVSHDATRSGAPIVLLNFLKWLNINKSYKFSVLLKNNGLLLTDFKQVAPIYLLNNNNNKNILSRFADKAKRFFLKKYSDNRIKLNPKLQKEKFDLIYINTIVSLDLAYTLKNAFDCPVVAHIHENEFAVHLLYPNGLNQIDIDAVDKFIAVSKNTKNNLVDNYNIPVQKVIIIYPFISVNNKREITKTKQVALAEYNLENSFVVGGSGECNWRKGVDLFIQLGFLLNKIRPGNNVKLLWIGHFNQEFESQKNYELKMLGIKDKVHFIGSKPDPQNYFQLFDVFALTSREDPFPLVALEAASMEIPVIFFEDAGGMSDLFIDEKGGIKTAYGNVEDMAQAILNILDNPEIKSQKGKEAAHLVKDYDMDIICKQLVNTIETVINHK